MLTTRDEFARIVGMSTGWVSKALDEGMPAERAGRSGARVQIDTAQALPWLLARAAKLQKREGVTERDRLAQEQADGKAIENAQKRRELVRAEHVRAVMLEAVSQLGAELDGVPGRMANELAGISEPAEVRARLLDQLRQARTAYADRLAKLGELLPTAGRVGRRGAAAAEEDAEPVGGRKPRAASRKRGARKVPKR